MTILVDAKAVLCAAAEGRTSAMSLKHFMRQLAALSLAGDFLLQYVYVPSMWGRSLNKNPDVL